MVAFSKYSQPINSFTYKYPSMDPLTSECFHFTEEKLLDIIGDLNYRVSILENENKRLSNRLEILENNDHIDNI